MSDQSLKSFYDRIWALMDEREGIQADIRDVFDEAKDAGYVPKVLRKIITRHRAKDQSKLQREDALQSDYEATLDGKTKAVLAELRAGATFDATAEKTGVPRRTVARLAEAVPEKKESGTQDVPHDPETGEVKETEVAVPPGDGEAPALRGAAGTPSPIIREATDEELRLQRESWVRGETAMGSDRDEARARAMLRLAELGQEIDAGADAPAAGLEGGTAPALATPRPAGEAEIAGRSNDVDDLAIPDSLRRTKVAA